MTWSSVWRISSRHTDRSEVGMGSNAQYVGLVFIIVCSCEIVTGLNLQKESNKQRIKSIDIPGSRDLVAFLPGKIPEILFFPG